MKYNDRLNKFIELQNKNMDFEDIALEIGIAKSTLRSFLNKNGYKLYNGKYRLKDDVQIKEIEFEGGLNNTKTIKSKEKSVSNNKKNNKSIKKEIDKKTTKTEGNVKKTTSKKIKKGLSTKESNNLNKSIKRQTPKKDRKINITQEDLDKLCEVYDWYMEVKDLKSIKNKPKTNKKDIKVEDTNLTDLKSTSIKVDKSTWEDFERLCSNSEFTKQEIITQALKDFMKEYKNLL